MKVASRSKDAWLAEIRYKKQRQEVPSATRLRAVTAGTSSVATDLLQQVGKNAHTSGEGTSTQVLDVGGGSSSLRGRAGSTSRRGRGGVARTTRGSGGRLGRRTGRGG